MRVGEDWGGGYARRCYVPAHAVVYDEVKTLLLRVAGGDAETGVIGLVGVGGVGKSTLASALAEDATVQGAFPDGFAWFSLGAHLSHERFVQLVQSVVSAVAGFPLEGTAGSSVTGHDDASTVSAGAAEYFRVRRPRVLVVVDGVEESEDRARLEELIVMLSAARSGGRVAVLFTAMPRCVGSCGFGFTACVLHPLDPRADDARAVFDSWAKLTPLHGSFYSPERSKILQCCGGLPTALAIAGASLRKSGYNWDMVAKVLDSAHSSAGTGRFDGESVILLLLEWLLGMWGDGFGGDVLAFAALPRGVPVPDAILALLWASSDSAVRVKRRRLERHGLAVTVKSGGRIGIRLHSSIARVFSGSSVSIAAIHCALVHRLAQCNALRESRAASGYRNWWSILGSSQYMDEWLTWHMVAGGMEDELELLVCDFRWYGGRLNNGSSDMIRRDFECILGSPAVRVNHESLKLLGEVLADACRGEVQSESQLAMRVTSEILARFEAQNDPIANRALSSVRRHAERPLFLPEKQRAPALHCGFVAKLVVSHASPCPCAVSIGEDGNLKVWSLEEHNLGDCILELKSLSCGHASAAVFQDYIYSGGGDGILRIYSLNSGRCVKALAVHECAVTAIVVACDRAQTSTYVATGAADGTVAIFIFDDGKDDRIRQTTYAASLRDEVTALHLIPASGKLVVGSFEGFSSVWSWINGERLPLNGHKNHVTQFCSLGDISMVASSCSSGFAYVWSVTSGHLLWCQSVGYNLSSRALSLYCSQRCPDVVSAEKRGRRCSFFCAFSDDGRQLKAFTVAGDVEQIGQVSTDDPVTALEEAPVHQSGGTKLFVLLGLQSGIVRPMLLVTDHEASLPRTSSRLAVTTNRRTSTRK